MPIHRTLRRRWMVQALQRVARRYKGLDYARFVIKAENEVNPERSNDPDYNFSKVESVMGWVAAIPINLRSPDIRIYVDSFDRPDLYAIRYCDNARRMWNDDPAYYPLYIYRIYQNATEITARTRNRSERRVEIYYDYLRTMQGHDEVRQVDAHLANTAAGIDERRAAIQGAADIREVERVRERVLNEIEGTRRG